jgi:hypothetical protein
MKCRFIKIHIWNTFNKMKGSIDLYIDSSISTIQLYLHRKENEDQWGTQNHEGCIRRIRVLQMEYTCPIGAGLYSDILTLRLLSSVASG